MLLRFNKDQKYMVFDFESCHLNLVPGMGNLPWQCSFIICTKDKILEEYDLFPYWQNLNISKSAAAITRFTYENYALESTRCHRKYFKASGDTTSPKKALDLFERYLFDDSLLLVGHNILNFDIYIHNIWRHELNLKTNYNYINRCLDTNCLEKAITLQEKPDLNDLVSWQYRFTTFRKKNIKTSLGFLCKKYNIEVDDNLTHDGLYDVRLNYNLLKKQLLEIDL